MCVCVLFIKIFYTSELKGNQTVEVCSTTETAVSNYLYMLLAGHGLQGVSGVLIYTIAPAFIDGSVSDKQSPVYISKSIKSRNYRLFIIP